MTLRLTKVVYVVYLLNAEGREPGEETPHPEKMIILVSQVLRLSQSFVARSYWLTPTLVNALQCLSCAIA